MLDLKIVNGLVVDGTGAPARRGAVGIRAGKIVAVGEVLEDAHQTLDAEGALITPGFVDIHGHYDGQVSWDADMAPSSLHGVTTSVSGNCGVGFAPVRPEDRMNLIRLMEGVEDIPGTALAEGMTWGWQSFPEYMDTIDSFPHAIDFAVQIPHDAVRVFVMGDRALRGEPATDADIQAMRALVYEGLQAGAIGFSTGRTDNHRAADGSHTPAAVASIQELTGIAQAFEGLSHGVLQAVSDFDMTQGPEHFDAEFDVIEQLLKAAHGHRLSVSLMQRDQAPGQWQRILARSEALAAQGHPIRVQVATRAIGVLLGLEATFHPFMGFPSYKAISRLPLTERVARMRAPEFKARILTERSEPVSGDGSPIPPLADLLLARLDMLSARLFRLGEYPNYEPRLQASLLVEARQKGLTPLEVMYDALLEDEGHELLYFPLYNYGKGNLEDVATMLAHPLALLGLGDGGAHVGTICDASFSTFLLSHWTRDKEALSIEKAIRMLTHDNAAYLGLTDRGTLEVGKKADLNLIDLEKLRLQRPRLVADLPAGGTRFLQEAEGFRATIVSGQLIRQDGRFTGNRPGRLVRLGG